MSDEPRALDWTRFPGAFANVDEVPPSSGSVIGIAADICPCCDERYVVIAAVHAGGFEIRVSLEPSQALALANRIPDSYAKIAKAAPAARQ